MALPLIPFWLGRKLAVDADTTLSKNPPRTTTEVIARGVA
jgi:hypothetical protein